MKLNFVGLPKEEPFWRPKLRTGGVDTRETRLDLSTQVTSNLVVGTLEAIVLTQDSHIDTKSGNH